MNYNQLIKNWHAKASDEDYFARFIFEHLAFIAYLRTQKYFGSSNDREVLQKLKQDQEVKKRYLQGLNSQQKKSWEILIREFQSEARLGNAANLNTVEEVKWWNHVCDSDSFCRGNGCGSLPNGFTEFSYGMKGVIYGIEDWPNMIEFWRTIRDNLFHGAKDPENKRDKLVAEHGFKTLRPLVEVLLSNEK